MLLENFKIVDSIAIEFVGAYLDLHSNFDFINLAYNIDERVAELDWKKCSGEWAKLEQYSKLKLIFKTVELFSVNPRECKKPFSEDDSLSYIGYLHPEDLSMMEGFLPPEQADDNYHMILGFESGLAIKLYSESVLLIVE